MSTFDDPPHPQDYSDYGEYADYGDDALAPPPEEAAAAGAFDALEAPTPELVGDVDAALAELERYIGAARASALSPLVRIDRDHAIELIRQARARLPVALRSARWLIKERADYLARAQRDAEDLVDRGKAEAARLVQRTEVVKQAELRARRIVDSAEEQARRQRLELEDYCDEHLGRFEQALQRALQNVREGRRRLQGETFEPQMGEAAPEATSEIDIGRFFDQDQL